MGGSSESIAAHLAEHWVAGMSLPEGIRLAIAALASSPGQAGAQAANGPREISLDDLEVALLQRDRPRRTFRRIGRDRLRELADG